MDLLYAVVLGLLQGATEFLPISSSGHLVLAEAFLGVEQASLAFDVALHLGTLVAIVIYFRRDFAMMGKALLNYKGSSTEERMYRKLAIFICLATAPAIGAALLWGETAATTLRQPRLVSFALAGGGLLLLVAERYGSRQRSFRTISWQDALLIGLAQAFALFPGVSRSGITMTAGLLLGLDRDAVARFSFLLSAPVILGAGVYHLPNLVEKGLPDGQYAFFLIGFMAAAFSGYLFISLLIKYLRVGTFKPFAYYRFLLAGLVWLALLI